MRAAYALLLAAALPVHADWYLDNESSRLSFISTHSGSQSEVHRFLTLHGQIAADGRALARGVRVAGKVEPVFVEDVGAMHEAIRDFAQAGDVVIVMGAGSISKVPEQLGSLR